MVENCPGEKLPQNCRMPITYVGKTALLAEADKGGWRVFRRKFVSIQSPAACRTVEDLLQPFSSAIGSFS